MASLYRRSSSPPVNLLCSTRTVSSANGTVPEPHGPRIVPSIAVLDPGAMSQYDVELLSDEDDVITLR